MAFKLIHKSTESWWILNPMGAVTSSERIQINELKEQAEDLVGFFDGSCQRKGNFIKAGMEGIIFNKANETIFSFSGPASVDTPLEAEWQAFKYLVEAFAKSEWKGHHLIIFSDCLEVVHKVPEILVTRNAEGMQEIDSKIKSLRLEIKHISGDLNSTTDSLAKKRANLPSPSQFWVQHKCSMDRHQAHFGQPN